VTMVIIMNYPNIMWLIVLICIFRDFQLLTVDGSQLTVNALTGIIDFFGVALDFGLHSKGLGEKSVNVLTTLAVAINKNT